MNKALEEFREEAKQEGRQEGRLEGRQEGRLEGIKESSSESAVKMLKDGMLPTEKIAEYTGLSVGEVEKLAKAGA